MAGRLAFAVVALFAVRIVAVFVALVRTGVPVRQQFFIGWFGPRGIGTVVLGLLVVNRGEIQSGGVMATVVVVVVTLSLVLHSVTARAGNPDVGGSALAAQGRVRRRGYAATSRLRSDHEMSR